jgi:hypothetical protein
MPPSPMDPGLELLSCDRLANQAAVADVLVLNSHKKHCRREMQERQEGMDQNSS